MQKQFKKGFTLIELLVVLAIIGILIALAIVGLNAAQSAQRDTSRKDIASQVNSEIQQYISNNGCVPEVGSCKGITVLAGTSSAALLNYPGGCLNGMAVNGTCLGLDGLALTTGAIDISCDTGPPAVVTSQMTLCYNINEGTAGYKLGVLLEASSSKWYMIAS